MKKMNIAFVGAGNYTGMCLQRFFGQWGNVPSLNQVLSETVDKIILIDHLSDQINERINKIENGKKNDKILLTPKDIIQYSGDTCISDCMKNENIDVVFVNTPVGAHLKTARPFLETGIPTFVSKPMSDNCNDIERLSYIAEQTGTINATASQMLFDPVFLEGLQYIKDNGVGIRKIKIDWTKARGPRDHPVPGVTIEEGSHPFGLLSALMGDQHFYVDCVMEQFDRVIINPDKWNYFDNKDKKVRILEQNVNYKGKNVHFGLMQSFSKAILSFDNDERCIADIENDFSDPYKQRVIYVTGDAANPERGEGLDDLFDNQVTIRMDLTDIRNNPEDIENSPYVNDNHRLLITRGVTDVRSGLGKVIVKKGDDDYTSNLPEQEKVKAFRKYFADGKKPDSVKYEKDDLAEQMFAFLSYAANKKRPEVVGLLDFKEGAVPEYMVHEVLEKIK